MPKRSVLVPLDAALRKADRAYDDAITKKLGQAVIARRYAVLRAASAALHAGVPTSCADVLIVFREVSTGLRAAYDPLCSNLLPRIRALKRRFEHGLLAPRDLIELRAIAKRSEGATYEPGTA